MARTTATNFSGGLQFPYATAATDIFKKEDLQTLAQAVDQHDHTAGKGVAVNTTPAAGSITNAMLGADVARANLLTNGGFEFWSRGAGAFTSTATIGPDRWSISVTSGTVSVSRDTANVDTGSQYCAVVVTTGASLLQQFQVTSTDGAQIRGRTFSTSLRVKTSTANAVRVALNTDGTGGTTVYSAYHPGSGAYVTLIVTTTVPTDATYLVMRIYVDVACTAYLDNAMLVVGSQAANYVPMHPADDLARCLRYYEVPGSGAAGNLIVDGNAAGAGQTYYQPFQFRAVKPVTPTVTKVGTWNTINAGQPVIDSIDVTGFRLSTSAVASGLFMAFNSTAGNTITAESNP